MPLPYDLNELLSPNTNLEQDEYSCLPSDWMCDFEANNNEVCFRVSGVPELLHSVKLYGEFESISRKSGPHKSNLLRQARANIPEGWKKGNFYSLGKLMMSADAGFDIRQLHKARTRRPMRFDKACVSLSILDVFLKNFGLELELLDHNIRIFPTIFRVPDFDKKIYNQHIKGWANRDFRVSFRRCIGQSQGKFFNFKGNNFLRKASTGGCYSYATAKGIYIGLNEVLEVKMKEPGIICESLNNAHKTVMCEATP
jgi:hypothetical protein